MDRKVFISYAHSNIRHVESVKEFAEELVRKKIDVELDLYQGSPKNHGTWTRWMKSSFKKASHILIIINEDYSIAFENDDINFKNQEKLKGVYYEITLLLDEETERYGDLSRFSCVALNKKDFKYIPPYLRSRLSIYNLSEQKDFKKLIEKLPISKERQPISFKKNYYDDNFIQFINRKTEKKLLENFLISTNDNSQLLEEGKIINIWGPPQIGKTEFTTNVINECSKICEEQGIEVIKATIKATKIFKKHNKNSLPFKKALIKEILVLLEKEDNKILEEDLSIEKLTQCIDMHPAYLIIILDDFSDYTNSFHELKIIFNEILEALYQIRFNPTKSDFSMVILTNKKIKEAYDIPTGYSKAHEHIELKPLNRRDIEEAVISYLAHKNLNLSNQLDKLADSFWNITQGLPGLAQKVFSEVNDKTQLLYHFYDKKKSSESMSRAFNSFMQEKILQSSSLKSDLIEVKHQDIEKLIEKLCVFRTIEAKTADICVEQIASKDTKNEWDLYPIERILDGINFIGNNIKYQPNPSAYEIDIPIRQLLFNYFYPDNKEKIKMHTFASEIYYNGLESIINSINKDNRAVFSFKSSNYFYEYIWHTVEIHRISKSSLNSLNDQLLVKIKTKLFNKINDECLKTIKNTIAYYYNLHKNTNSIADMRQSVKKVEMNSLEDNDFYKNFPLNVLEIGD